MAKIPEISGREMGRILIRLGFQFKSQKGAHLKFIRQNKNGKETVIIPNHHALRKGTLHGLLKQLNLNVDKFRELL